MWLRQQIQALLIMPDLQLFNYKITALMSLILSEMYPGYSSNCTFNLLYRHGHYKVSLF